MTESYSQHFAAIDLGSNSFHMIISRVNQGTVETIDKVKEMVQIARGMDKNQLSEQAQLRAISCLERFAERLEHIPAANIRAVGTKSLRAATNAKTFLKRAELALGQPITIISGYEEARLVYSGLSHVVTNDNNRRLVIDIGGASTEFVAGTGSAPALLESLNFGCVAYTEQFLKTEMSDKNMYAAYVAASADMEVIRYAYLNSSWDIAYGTSGTIRAIAELVSTTDGGAIIRAKSLDSLFHTVAENPQLLEACPKLRRDVLPAGIAILKACFDSLKLSKIHVADATLKDGLIYDTIGRFSRSDARIAAVAKLQRQYHVELPQADRVAKSALGFWQQLDTPNLPGVSRTKILTWAAQLHEVGLGISHSGHHHHSYYILSHSDLAGFGRYEQWILAHLVRAHRKKLHSSRFEGLNEAQCAALFPMVLCLRLAVILHRNRQPNTIEPALVQRSDSKFALVFAHQWLGNNPLTTSSLEKEVQQLTNLDIHLTITEATSDDA